VIHVVALLSVPSMETTTDTRPAIDSESLSFAGLLMVLVLTNMAAIWVAVTYPA
jgi:hypothetical protein